MSFKRHTLLVSDQEIDFILAKLLDEYDELSIPAHEDDEKVQRFFYNRYSFDFYDFYNRCEDVFKIFREEAFR